MHAALAKLQEDCHVANLKMSDYSIEKDNLRKYAVNARRTMGGLFDLDPVNLTEEDCIDILTESYR